MTTRIGRDALIGVTVLAAFAGLVAMLAVFGELHKFTTRQYTFEIQLDTARGLSGSSNVTLNGVRVGSVRSLTPAPDPREGVIVIVGVAEGTVVPGDFGVFVDSSLLGQGSLELTVPQDSIGDAPPVRPGDRHVRRLGSLTRSLEAQFEGPVASVAGAAERLRELAETYDRVGRRVESLLEPQDAEALQRGESPNLRTAIANLDRAASGVASWTEDDGLRADAQSVLAQASGVAERAGSLLERAETTLAGIDRARGRVDDAVAGVRADVGVLRDRADAALARVGGAADEIRSLAERLQTGDGTAALLLRNPDLYQNLTAAAARLENALVEVQLLVQKFKAEGVPIQF